MYLDLDLDLGSRSLSRFLNSVCVNKLLNPIYTLFKGLSQDDIRVQWERLELSVQCAANKMKLVAREPEASQLQLVQSEFVLYTGTKRHCLEELCIEPLSLQKMPNRFH